MPVQFWRIQLIVVILSILAIRVAAGSGGLPEVPPAGSTVGLTDISQLGTDSAGPRASAADATRLVGWVNRTDRGITSGNYSVVENVLFMTESPALPGPESGQMWDLGRGFLHTGPGVTDFVSSNDPDLPMLNALLTDGLDEYIGFEIWFHPQGGGGAFSDSESRLLGRTPDLVGYEVDFFRLNITSLTFNYSAGLTNYNETWSWEFWGHPLFTFFLPPTDPNGAYLIDRNVTTVRVGLAGRGAAMLEWNGMNRSMSANGTNWSTSVSGLANGAYAYRVWATNETGAVYDTAIRQLTVGVGIWRSEHVGYGFSPSVAVNATGFPQLCYEGGGGLVYAARSPAGWANATIGGSGGGCSIGVNSKGEVRISHVVQTPGGDFDVRYTHPTASGWSTTTIQHGFYTPTSIAINPVTDEPMIAYSQVNSEGLKLATLSGDQWTTQVVDPSFYGQTISLAIDPAGHPAIAYRDYTAGTLRVAHWTGSQWMTTTLDVGVTATSIRFDAGGVAHVAYAVPAGLIYATWNGTAWSMETVDRGRYFSVSLVFDPSGRAYIGYAMAFAGDVREAVKDGTWRIQVITHRLGWNGASLAAMPDGSAVAAYDLNDTKGDIVVASDFIDTRAPVSQVLLNGTAGSGGWYRSPVNVHFEAADDWSGVASIESRLDGGAWTAYVGNFRVSSEGRHVLEYRATDFARNVEPLKSTSIDIDLSPPDVTITAPVGIVTTSSVAVLWRGKDSLSGIGFYGLTLDGGLATSIGLQENATVTLGPGSHTIRIRGTDVAGNSAVSEVVIVVDTNPFSFSGPYRGLPTIAIVVASVAAAVVVVLFRLRKRKRMPPGPPVMLET